MNTAEEVNKPVTQSMSEVKFKDMPEETYPNIVNFSQRERKKTDAEKEMI